MATRDVFSEDELAQLRGFPEPARAELIGYFTLAPADEAFVRKFRGRDSVLGAAVQLCTLPWLGYVPADVAAAPAAAVARLSAKLVVGKLCSSRRQQNALAAAIKEYGALRRTIYAARYLADETYRRRIARQLNKGENLHALRRSLAYAGEGALRRRHHEEQTEQIWCLTLATNAVVTWTTEYHGLAVTALRRAGWDIDHAVLAHIWPTHHESVHFYGSHSVDVDGELAKLDSDGHRSLRPPGPAPAADQDR